MRQVPPIRKTISNFENQAKKAEKQERFRQAFSSPQEAKQPSKSFTDRTVNERRTMFQYLRLAMARRELVDVVHTLEESDEINKTELVEICKLIENLETKLYDLLSLEDYRIPPRSGISTRGPIK